MCSMQREKGVVGWDEGLSWLDIWRQEKKRLHILKRAHEVDEHRNQYCLLSDSIGRLSFFFFFFLLYVAL